jgi:hypothetical protein
MTNIFIINTCLLAGLNGFFSDGFYHLFRRFVHANYRKILIIRALVNLQNLFHVSDRLWIAAAIQTGRLFETAEVELKKL